LDVRVNIGWVTSKKLTRKIVFSFIFRFIDRRFKIVKVEHKIVSF
jgi:hypothetical protein